MKSCYYRKLCSLSRSQSRIMLHVNSSEMTFEHQYNACPLSDVTTFLIDMLLIAPGGGLPYETDGDARRLAQGCKFLILVSLRLFRAKRQYFKPPRSRLGFREETQNKAKRNRSQIFFLTCCVYRITSVSMLLKTTFR